MTWKILILTFAVVFITIIEGQSPYNRQPSYSQGHQQNPATSGSIITTRTNHHPSPYTINPNIGIIKTLEARVSALEELIKEFETKEILIREREQELELRRIALDKIARDNEKRFRDREIALDKREQEITNYQNSIFKQQDEREQELEKERRGRESILDQRERIVEGKEKNLY